MLEIWTDNSTVKLLCGGSNGAIAPVTLDTGWHHLAVVVNGTAARFYWDGSAMTMSDSGVSALGIDATNLRIGSGLNGALDDVRVYDRALTEAEVAGLAE